MVLNKLKNKHKHTQKKQNLKAMNQAEKLKREQTHQNSTETKHHRSKTIHKSQPKLAIFSKKEMA